MAKMAKLTRTKTDREADQNALGRPADVADDGVHLHLSDHHLKAMGVHGNVEAGRRVHIHAKGVIKHSSSDQEQGGKKRKSLHVHLTHMRMEKGETPEEESGESASMEREELRKGIEGAYEEHEKKRGK